MKSKLRKTSSLCFSDTHRSYDPLAYPLFFLYGTDGWNCHVKSLNLENKTDFSLVQCVWFHMMERYHHNFLHDGRKFINNGLSINMQKWKILAYNIVSIIKKTFVVINIKTFFMLFKLVISRIVDKW